MVGLPTSRRSGASWLGQVNDRHVTPGSVGDDPCHLAIPVATRLWGSCRQYVKIIALMTIEPVVIYLHTRLSL